MLLTWAGRVQDSGTAMWLFAWFGYWVNICLVLSIKAARGTLNDARAKYNLRQGNVAEINKVTNQVNEDLHPHHHRHHEVGSLVLAAQVRLPAPCGRPAWLAPAPQRMQPYIIHLFRLVPRLAPDLPARRLSSADAAGGGEGCQGRQAGR